jgi:adenosine deaminase
MGIKYSITIQELLERPIIRNDYFEEWMNKMTDDELNEFEKESYQICIKNGTPEKFPDINAACLSKHIDRNTLYELLKQEKILI